MQCSNSKESTPEIQRNFQLDLLFVEPRPMFISSHMIIFVNNYKNKNDSCMYFPIMIISEQLQKSTNKVKDINILGVQ